jgi:hypothetical protein
MRPPIEHAYTLDGDAYLLREATMLEGQQRISQHYALMLTLAPSTLHPDTGLPLVYSDALWAGYARNLELTYGATLYAKAVTQECLVEAPDLWWMPHPVQPGLNGTVKRVITFKAISAALWTAHMQEVNVFLEQIFRLQTPDAAPAPAGSPGQPDVVAPPETVSPGLRGRAE